MPNTPHRFNIIFNDTGLFEEVQSFIGTYTAEWQKTAQGIPKIQSNSSNTIQQKIIREQDRGIDKFRKSQISTDSFSQLNQKCYWEEGEYEIIVSVNTSRPNRSFTKKYKFKLSQSDSKNLKLNTVTMLEEPIYAFLGKANYPYNFAYSNYIE